MSRTIYNTLHIGVDISLKNDRKDEEMVIKLTSENCCGEKCQKKVVEHRMVTNQLYKISKIITSVGNNNI